MDFPLYFTDSKNVCSLFLHPLTKKELQQIKDTTRGLGQSVKSYVLSCFVVNSLHSVIHSFFIGGKTKEREGEREVPSFKAIYSYYLLDYSNVYISFHHKYFKIRKELVIDGIFLGKLMFLVFSSTNCKNINFCEHQYRAWKMASIQTPFIRFTFTVYQFKCCAWRPCSAMHVLFVVPLLA